MEKLTEQPGHEATQRLIGTMGRQPGKEVLPSPETRVIRQDENMGRTVPVGVWTMKRRALGSMKDMPLPEKRHYPRLSAKERNTLTSPLLPHSSASH